MIIIKDNDTYLWKEDSENIFNIIAFKIVL